MNSKRYTFLGRCILLGAFSLTLIEAGWAQKKATFELSGKVVDEFGNPVPGALVQVKDTEEGALTDVNGVYRLKQSINGTTELECSAVGYATIHKATEVGEDAYIKLQPDASFKDEDIYLLHEKRTHMSVSSAVSVVRGDELVKTPHMNILASLAGRLPGLIIQQNRAEPGNEGYSFYIRGSRTSNGQTPVILIDGVVASNLEALNPHDVEMVAIYKDAAATALYGLQGGNGIISVITKRGSFGAPSISVNADFSMQQPIRTPEMIHSWEYAQMKNQAADNDGLGQSLYYSQEEIDAYRSGTNRNLFADTDWYNMYMEPAVHTQQYNVSAYGGSSVVKYYANVGYTHQGDPYKVEEADRYNPARRLDRFNFRTNMDVKMNKYLSAFMNLSGQVQRNGSSTSSTGDIYSSLFNMPSTIYGPLTSENQVIATATEMNPTYGRINRSGYARATRVNMDAILGLKLDLSFLLDGLSTSAQAMFDTRSNSSITGGTDYERWERDMTNTDELVFKKIGTQVDKPVSLSKGVTYNYLYEYRWDLNYHKKIGDHDINALFFIKNQQESKDVTGIVGILPYIRMTYGGHIGYGYKDLFFADLALSYDGSEQFAPDYRYGLFPAISAAWNIHNHSFMKDISWLSNLKLRASFGQVGNDQLLGKRYLYLENNKKGGGGWGSYGSATIEEYERGNPKVQWETSDIVNVGIEAGFLNQLTFGLDYFYENRHDILLLRNVLPSTYGISSGYFPIANMGQIINKGFEIQLGYHKALTKDFAIDIRTHLGFNTNEVKNLDEVPFAEDFAYRYNRTGFRSGQKWGYLIDRSNGSGFFNSEEEIQKSGLTYEGRAPRPGDFIYEDLNGDGIIDKKDKAPMGYSSIPRIEYGANMSFTWKKFDFSMLIQGLAQTSSFASGRGYYEYENTGSYFHIHKYAWTAQKYANHETILAPALSTSQSASHKENDYYLRDNSCVRLKNLELGYRLPLSVAKLLRTQSVRVYLSGQNLLTLDKLDKDLHNGIDPEMGGITSFPSQRIFNLGLNVTF